MNKTKASFGLMIIFFVFIILVTSVFYQDVSSLQESIVSNQKISGYLSFGGVGDFLFSGPKLTEYTGNNSECTFKLPEEKTIVLRIDDLGAWHYFDTVVDMTGEIQSRNMSASLGVIPYDLERDQKFINWIISIKDDYGIEIAQHGYNHAESEFQNLNSLRAYESIINGKEEIVTNLKVVPITFIPPSNDYNEETIIALEEASFKIISARNSELDFNGSMVHLGADTSTADYFEKRFIPVEEVLSECERQFEEKNFCVITMHPQDYVEDGNPEKADKIKYAEFIRLLDEIENLNVQTKTFKDFLSCEAS